MINGENMHAVVWASNSVQTRGAFGDYLANALHWMRAENTHSQKVNQLRRDDWCSKYYTA